MSLSTIDVLHAAHLARIAITPAESEATLQKLNSIFNLIETMQAVDTTNIEPMAHALDVSQRLRPDEVTESNQRELLQSIAPQVENGLYLVPKVIE